MKSSAVLCLVLLTVIFASSVKFSAGFPSAAAEKISDDLKTFEGRRSVSRGSRPNFLVYLSRFFLEHSLTNFTFKIMLRIQSRFKGVLIQCTFTSQGRKQIMLNENSVTSVIFHPYEDAIFLKKVTLHYLSCDLKTLD